MLQLKLDSQQEDIIHFQEFQKILIKELHRQREELHAGESRCQKLEVMRHCVSALSWLQISD